MCEVQNSFPVRCHGISGILIKNDRGPVDASVTIFTNGDREVGCGYLSYNPQSNGDQCSAGISVDCPHLKPQVS